MVLQDIVVVDDSPTMRMLIAFALGKYWGCGIREAGNGIEALQRVEEQRPDLVVVDINMPEMNGLELIRALRSRSDTKDLPIVVVTTEGSDDDVRRGMQAGATEYLVKPFQPQKLHAIIERMFTVEA